MGFQGYWSKNRAMRMVLTPAFTLIELLFARRDPTRTKYNGHPYLLQLKCL